MGMQDRTINVLVLSTYACALILESASPYFTYNVSMGTAALVWQTIIDTVIFV